MLLFHQSIYLATDPSFRRNQNHNSKSHMFLGGCNIELLNCVKLSNLFQKYFNF